MAVYKVPQDVEADDKLIGPFSFRQFIYLIAVALGILMGYGFFRLFPPLLIIPLPIVVFFGALALPLRKDQPMEVYLAAVLSFFLKPRRRLWQPDGIQSLIEITAPKEVEVQRAKDLTQMEAEQRLSYLANIVDTEGWAVRGVDGAVQPASPMQNDVYFAAQQTEDVLDDTSGVAQTFNTMIGQADARRRQEMMDRIKTTQTQTPVVAPAESSVTPDPTPTVPVPDPYAALTPAPPSNDDAAPHLSINPYPNMQQRVIQPMEDGSEPTAPTPAANPPQTTGAPAVSPDIINLANNSDLSIETIAHEANRIHEKEEKKLPDDEVVISLR